MKYLAYAVIVAALFFAALTAGAQAVRVFTSEQVGTNPVNGYCLTTNGATSTWAPCGTGGSGTPGGGNLQLQFNDNGTFGGTSTPSVTAINATSTTASSTLANIIVQKLQSLTSAGLTFFSNSGTPVADFGAGGGSNASFFGGVNIDGQTRLATSLNGLAVLTNGVVSATATPPNLGTVYLATTSPWTVGSLAYVTGAGSVGSVATGTLTETATGLSLSGSPVVMGGSSVLTIDSGFTLASTTGLTNLYSFYDTPSSRITAGTGIDWTGNTLNVTLGDFTTANLTESGNLYFTDARARAAISETVTGLDYTSGTGVLSLTSGYVIPTSTLWTNVSDFYTTPSTRITANDGLTWSGNNLNFDGGNAPGGELGGTWASPTIDDGLAVTNWNLTTPTLTSFFGTPCTGNQFLQDISDTGAFTCVTAAGSNTVYLASSTGYTTGGLAYATGPGTISTRATTTLVAGTGITFSGGTPVIIGSSPITIESTGGVSGGGALSTTTDLVGDGPVAVASYILGDVMFGGSASTSAEFQFDADGSKLIISSSSAQATTTILNTNLAQAVRFGTATSGLEFDFRTPGQAFISGVGAVATSTFTGDLRVEGNVVIEGDLEAEGQLMALIIATIAAALATYTMVFTNKRIQPRTASSTSNANLTPDLSSANVYYRTTQTTGLVINAPTGTPVIGETIMIYVDSASAQSLTINATFVPFGAAFPATTTAGKTFMLSAQYNGTNWKTLWANQV